MHGYFPDRSHGGRWGGWRLGRYWRIASISTSLLLPSSPMLREGGVVGVVGGLALVGAAPPPSGVSGGGGRGCRRGSRSDKQLKETAKPPSMAGRVQVRVHVRVTARMKVWVNVRMQERQARSRCRQTQECIVSLAKDGGGSCARVTGASAAATLGACGWFASGGRERRSSGVGWRGAGGSCDDRWGMDHFPFSSKGGRCLGRGGVYVLLWTKVLRRA